MQSSNIKGYVVFFFLLISIPVFAITDEEVFRNFQFSFVNPGARSTAMGGAFIALADDATATEANPAGLNLLVKPEVSFEYRHTGFDQKEANSSNEIPNGSQITTVSSTNQLDSLNQASFFSVVLPVKAVVFAFSRQEAAKLDGTLGEQFHQTTSPISSVQLTSSGEEHLDVTNYSFSAATRLGDLLLGGSLRYSKLDWNVSVGNTEETLLPNQPPRTTLDFSNSLDDSDGAAAFNVGAIYNFKSHLSVGAVYKGNAKFSVTETETPNGNKAGSFENVLKIPDIFGIGVTARPTESLTISYDLVRIQYSDLLESFQAGYGIITDPLNNERVSYDIGDATEHHLGGEYFLPFQQVAVTIRAGYFRKPIAALAFLSAPNEDQNTQNVLAAVYAPRDDENHFTFGNGFVFKPHFQIDWAADLANSANSFVISAVSRF